MRIASLLLLSLLGLTPFVRADGERDNHPESVRRVPALGMEISAEDRQELQAGLDELNAEIAKLRQKKDARTRELLPDVIIFARAVDEAMRYQEFFKPGEIKTAKKHLQRGLERAKHLAKGEAPWTAETGLGCQGLRFAVG